MTPEQHVYSGYENDKLIAVWCAVAHISRLPVSTVVKELREPMDELVAALRQSPPPALAVEARAEHGRAIERALSRASRGGSLYLLDYPEVRETLDAFAAAVQSSRSGEPGGTWQPIETAPRNPPRDVLVFCPAKDPPRREVFQAWWAMPYEGAPIERGWWCYDGNKIMLSADLHGVGATKWMPLPPSPPQESSR